MEMGPRGSWGVLFLLVKEDICGQRIPLLGLFKIWWAVHFLFIKKL
jgi:hypothetical protein